MSSSSSIIKSGFTAEQEADVLGLSPDAPVSDRQKGRVLEDCFGLKALIINKLQLEMLSWEVFFYSFESKISLRI